MHRTAHQTATVALLALALCSCAGEISVNAPVQTDGKARQDQGSPSTSSVAKADSSVPAKTDSSPVPPTADAMAVAPAADLGGGVAGAKTCAELYTCVQGCACSDQACFNSCSVQGTADAQVKLKALDQCGDQAALTTCASACAAPSSQACGTCISTACAAQVQACFGS